MEKRNVYIVISVVLVVLAFFLAFNNSDITGSFGNPYRTCIDSDSTEEYPDGNNKYVKGTVIYTYQGRQTEYTDYCHATHGSGPEKYLKEYFCNLFGRVDTKTPDYNCEEYGSGCEDGACIKIKVECSDSDGGEEYYVKGETCFGTECRTDLCLDDIYLSERYCEDNEVKSGIYKCPNGCVIGHGVCAI